MRSLAAALLALGFALAPPPAEALEADELEADIEAFFDELRAGMAPDLLESGAVEVVPDGDALRVTLADLAVVSVTQTRRYELGTLSFRVGEPEPGVYAIDDLRLPDRMPITERGKEIGWVALDLERFAGEFSSRLQEFTQLDLLARGFELRIPKESLLVGFASFAGNVKTEPESGANGPTGYDRQVQSFRLEDLVLSDPEATVELGELAMDATVDGLDLDLYETLLAVMRDLETAAAQGDQGRRDALQEAAAAAIGIAEAIEATIRVAGIEALDPEGAETFRLDSLAFTVGLDTPRGNAFGAARLSLSGEGLALDPVTTPEIAPYIDIVPQSWNIPLLLEHVPIEALSRAMTDFTIAFADPYAVDPDSKLADIGNQVLEALGTAGSYLIIRDLFLEAPLLRLDSKASLAFSPNVELGLVGNWAFTLTGLDRVLALAESLTDPEAKRMLSGAVLALMGVGQAVALPDGRVGYRFSFSFAPDGAVTMNGFSFGDFLNKAIPQ